LSKTALAVRTKHHNGYLDQIVRIFNDRVMQVTRMPEKEKPAHGGLSLHSITLGTAVANSALNGSLSGYAVLDKKPADSA
jgi:hypothetical protein